MADGILLTFPAQPLEQTRLGTSRVLEAAHSWHVLADPSHHALHLPWVRACRGLPAGLRQQLREHSWAVRGDLPSFLEAGIAHPDATIEEEIALIRAVPAGQLVPELVLTLVDWPRDDDFAAEYERLEPSLHQAMHDAARTLSTGGPLGLLGGLIPEVILDPARGSVLIPRSHRHQVAVAEHGGITLVPSVYAWPHVRVTCDHPPWPLTLTYPVDPLIRPLAPALTPAQLSSQLRAVAAGPRLELLHLTGIEPRSTQELARLTQLSPAAISKHLQTLLAAGLLTRRRDGYYVLYAASRENLTAFTHALGRHLNARSE